MKKTEVVFILDKSGSMCDLKKDAVGGYNELLSKLKGLEEELYVTTVLFNNSYEINSSRGQDNSTYTVHSVLKIGTGKEGEVRCFV